MAKKVRVTGIKEAIQRLNEKQKKIDSGLLNILQDYTLRIEFQAKRLAPTDMGHLGQSISSSVIERKSTISANAEYAPFVEFGTRTKVKVPSGFESMAMKFKGKKGKGNFEDFKNNIYDWCKRKGIDKKYWYSVLLKILRVGTEPQPFLIPSYLEQKVKYEGAVKKYKNEIRW